MSVTYTELDGNLETCTSIEAKIVKIDAIINQLLTTAMKSVTNGHRAEYMLDDGQSKQRVVYSTTKSVLDAIKGYEAIRNYYSNKIVGHQYRNVDSRNLKFRG